MSEVYTFSAGTEGGSNDALNGIYDDYFAALEWIEPLIKLHSSDSNVQECKLFLTKYGITKQQETLSIQGLDSLKAASLGNDLESYIHGLNEQPNLLQSLFEWSGEDRVLAYLGITPEKAKAIIYGNVLTYEILPPVLVL